MPGPLKCIVADDEKPAREVLHTYIGRVEHLKLVSSCRNAFEVINFLQKDTADVLFLDIRMPQLDGLSLIRSLKKPPAVVLTTAYENHAVEAFELNAVDYLVKPFSFERFMQALHKLPGRSALLSPPQTETMALRIDRRIVSVRFDDILYLEGTGNYVKVHLADRTLIVYSSLRKLLTQLPPDQFRQIHKSYIISIGKVTSYSSAAVWIQGTRLPVGRSYRQ